MDDLSVSLTGPGSNTSENVDVCDTTADVDTNRDSSLSMDDDDDLAASACEICKSAITRRCAKVRRYGRLRSPDCVWNLGEEWLRGGARAGCRDCGLITSILDHFCAIGIEPWRVDLLFGVVSCGNGSPQLKINMIVSNASISLPEELRIFRSTADVPVEPQWSTIVQRSFLLQDTSSEYAFQIVSKWLHDCLQSHDRCSIYKTARLPKRILELTATTVLLRENLNRPAAYACLSHCWGEKGPALRLTSNTIDTLRSGVARAQLPETFKDAVEICDRLGIHFIWIDAMCIVQDNLKDWASTASVMADIYEGAYLTIAATASNDSNGGCFSRLRENFKDVTLGNTGLCARRNLPRFPKRPLHNDTTEWPLLERGWVFQERRLSTRVVHYARDQLFWECGSTFFSACGDQNWTVDQSFGVKNDYSNDMKFDGGDPRNGWRALITLYSKLKFTKSCDRLPALAGVVEREQRRRKDDTYVAGMWKNTLLEDLGFSQYTCYGNTPGIPSWSWACIEDSVNFTDIMYHRNATTELISIDTIPDGPSNMGKVVSASIRLKGPTFSIRAVAYLSTYLEYFLDNGVDQLANFDYNLKGTSEFYDDLDPDAELLLIVMSASIMEISGECTTLVLQRLPTGNFQRLGHGVLRYQRKDLRFLDRNTRDPALRAENMERFLALFTVREVEII
ncbi:HET-domain-containing protein [Karstenula rhodostoma CBS 690.94]|uniref:HET-domain-containing protein n=1 Tax=Karstenula rhodostoma CBS 690.94 TaxID=1392251 RepID=A0A9P4UEY5_9PLEO|nr:HET-domain-containing protein [Karstenula rhodostoma CBS 690.94]